MLPITWAPDPSIVERLARRPDVGAILIVAPFSIPLDFAVWDAVQRRAVQSVRISGKTSRLLKSEQLAPRCLA